MRHSVGTGDPDVTQEFPTVTRATLERGSEGCGTAREALQSSLGSGKLPKRKSEVGKKTISTSVGKNLSLKHLE